MKSTSLLSRKTSGLARIAAFAFLAAIGLNSCEKDDGIKPSATADQSNNIINTQSEMVALAEPVYLSLIINHNSGRSLTMPDYTVTIDRSGEVTYEGRRNVKETGIRTFKATPEMLLRIENVVRNTDLFNIKSSAEELPDVPLVYTTIEKMTTGGHEPLVHTLIDDYSGYPALLVDFRTKIESILGIPEFVLHNADTRQ